MGPGASFLVILTVILTVIFGSRSPALAVSSSAPTLMASQASPLTFEQWKLSRTTEARMVLDKLESESQLHPLPPPERLQIAKSNKTGGPSGAPKVHQEKASAETSGNSVTDRLHQKPAQDARRIEQRLRQARLNLEIAQELTVNDYFVLYLAQLKRPEAIQEAAKTLSPTEVTELLVAYQAQLLGATSESGPAARAVVAKTGASVEAVDPSGRQSGAPAFSSSGGSGGSSSDSKD